ncbi:MAG: CPBP family intramembrane metalloprotease [Bacteroidia bacterium]
MNYRKILRYLLFAFGFSWLLFAGMYAAGLARPGQTVGMMVTGMLFMWGPALAVLVVQKGIYRAPLTAYGWTLRKLDGRWLLASMLAPAGLLLLALLLSFVLGNVAGIGVFGRVDLRKEGIETALTAIAAQAGQPVPANPFAEVPLPGWALLLLILVGSILPGATLNAVFAFGEELGWRGLLLAETGPLGFWRSNLLIGIVWGLWHAPMIVMGHNYPGYPLWGVAMMVLFCTALSFPMAYLTRRAGSILAPSFFHGIYNASAGATALFVHEAHPLFAPGAGLAVVLAGGVLSTLLPSRAR